MSAIWPFFDLEVRTPRLRLRYADDAQVVALMRLAGTAGVHRPDQMPFGTPWASAPSPELERDGLRGHWRTRAELGPDRWRLPFAVYEDGVLVGAQALRATDFPVTRTVESDSWLALPHQGRGIGREMRAAVLHLAFAELGAELATTGAFHDNPASIAVSRALGYVDNGWTLSERAGSQVRDLSFRLERSVWTPGRRDDITVTGLGACLPLLGL